MKMFDACKTRMIGLPYGEKNYDDMLSRFHLIPERNGQTDRQTDGQTDRFAISISRVSMLTRNKNGTIRKLGYGFLFAFRTNSAASLAVSTKYTNVTNTGQPDTARQQESRKMAKIREVLTADSATSWKEPIHNLNIFLKVFTHF